MHENAKKVAVRNLVNLTFMVQAVVMAHEAHIKRKDHSGLERMKEPTLDEKGDC